MTDFAIVYFNEAYSKKNKQVMGRQAAGAGFLRAVANARPKRLWCHTSSPAIAKQCAQALGAFGAQDTQVQWVNTLDPRGLSEPGLVYRPDPLITPDAWRRLTHVRPRSYSICGVTHTTATHRAMEELASIPAAPLEEWDAIICTSVAVRDSVRSILENQIEYLRERLGATRLGLPQLPMIPLGVHCSDFAIAAERRQAVRAELGIAPGEVVVLFLGRLSYLDKAHPLPMYLALEACAKEAQVTLIEAGWFANDETQKAFKEDAKTLSPSVRHLYLNATVPEQSQQAWATADIFTSLSDNIQETFGLTPLEAMAAGLPVVVSDWNGYKDTVRHGVDGFRIPTLSMPPGTGQALAELYGLREYGGYNYHTYSGAASQLVAVDVAAATAAYRRLILDPDLRRTMGESGRERARTAFDWSVIFRRYMMLWEELAERRRAGPTLYPPLNRRVRPERPDPFTMFASYPSAAIGEATPLRRAGGASLQTAVARRELQTTRFAQQISPSPKLIGEILEKLGDAPDGSWTTFGRLIQAWAPDVRRPLFSAVVWLAKIGMIEFKLPDQAAVSPSHQDGSLVRPPG
jgi:alpha-maltose-1-phosphate synthase